MTVTDGKANVGAAVMVGVNVTVGVNVKVGNGISVDVGVAAGIFVHAADVGVMEVGVKIACSAGENPQALRRNRMTSKPITCFFI